MQNFTIMIYKFEDLDTDTELELFTGKDGMCFLIRDRNDGDNFKLFVLHRHEFDNIHDAIDAIRTEFKNRNKNEKSSV